MPEGQRVACRIEYDGGGFHGWQAQPQLALETVQETVQSALAAVATLPVTIHCAGRTDTGVHGYAQIIHFDAPVSRSEKSWVMGSNANMPPSVRMHWAVPVDSEFHARHSALSRRYRYIIANTPVRPALLSGRVTWQRLPLDERRMFEAAQHLLGEMDFSAFRAAACQSVSPMRNVEAVKVWRRDSLVVLDIRANAFLHHMVRNIAGALMAVGIGRREPVWIAELLEGGDRRLAAETAAPDGLYLVEVGYPPEFSLPAVPDGPWWI